jgi:eukaryotic-like serine/threonine-protein kinase
MSPEQVRGEAIDARSDIFSFGAVLYELLSGKRAFRGETSVESMHAILKTEPAEIKSIRPEVSPALEQVVRRCIEKNPLERYQSMLDVAYILQSIAGLSSEALPAVKGTGWRRWWPAIATLAAVLGFAAAELLHLTVWSTKPLNYQRFVVRQGSIIYARFAPGGKSAIYGAAWTGDPYKLFTAKPGGQNTPVALPLPNANILAISRTGQMAVALDYRQSPSATFFGSGTLARAPLEGGSPRELAENVSAADWSPDGESLAIVRDIGGKRQLEFPLGKVIYSSTGGIDSPRVAPDGHQIAFFEQPELGDNKARLMLVGLDAQARALTPLRDQSGGIAWRGKSEIWCTSAGNLYSISAGGNERLVTRFAGLAFLQDLAADGTALITVDTIRSGLVGKGPKDAAERDMTWLNRSRADAVSPDGELLLFSETGDPYSVYVRKTDGSPPVLLGGTNGVSLSPDKKWAFARDTFSRQTFFLPIGPGETRAATASNGVWAAPGEFLCNDGAPPHTRVMLDGFRDGVLAGKGRAVTPEGFSFASEVHEGSFICRDGDGAAYLCSISGTTPRKLAGLTAADSVRGWSKDGHWVFAAPRGSRAFPVSVDRVNLDTGKRERWKDIQPFETSGLVRATAPVVALDGEVYFYSYRRRFSELFLVEGLR